MTIIVLLLASAVATIWIDRNQVSQRHKDAIEIFRVSTTESVELLEHLHQHDALDCTADALMHLNTHLLMSRYIREIGVLDEERRLLCTTSLGLLPQPYKGGTGYIRRGPGLSCSITCLSRWLTQSSWPSSFSFLLST